MLKNKLERLQLKLARYRRIRLPRHRRKLKIMSRHPFAVPFFTVLILLILSLGGYLIARQTHHLPPPTDAKIVIVSHDGVQQIVPSKEPTVGALLTKLHISLGQGDRVEPALTAVINQDDFRINVYRGVPVTIVDNGARTFAFSAGTTARAIATSAGNQVYPEDDVTTEPTQNFLSGGSLGEEIIINRATPVNLNLYGTPLTIRTHAKTVGALLKAKHIKLGAKDEVNPTADTPLAPNTQVFIARQGTKFETVTETIAMPVQTINDSGLAFGTNAIRQRGSPGEQVITYQDELRNGVVVGRTIVQTVVTRPPVTQIVVIGTSLSGIKGDMALAGIKPSDSNYVDYIVSHESGWCPTKAQGQYGSCPPYAGYVPSTGGYGLCQSTPGSKMASAGADWATNPITQLRWCSGYAEGRYGSWYAAYEHWLSHHNW
jgi:uncharacterized protein YabE (DUF348 family)